MGYILLLLIPCLVLLLPFNLSFSFSEVFTLKITLLGIPILKYIPKKNPKYEKKMLNNFDFKINEIKTYIKVVKDVFLIFEKYVRKKLTVKKLLFCVSYGNGNAAETAIRCGFFYAVVYSFWGHILNRYTIKDYSINVSPDFENNKTNVDFYISTRITLISIISLLVQERKVLISLNNTLKKKDGVVNE